MKKTNIVQLGIAVAILSVSYSCKKDVISPSASNTNSTVQQNDVLEKSKIIEDKIITFKTNLKTYESNKSGEPTVTYEVDDAIWYLEATLNYTYSNPDDITEERSVESFNVIMNKTIEGTVDFVELQGVYNETVSSLQTIYAASDYTETTFLMCDLEVISEDAQNVTLRVNGYIGEKVDIGDKNGITTGWTWGFKQGYYHNGTFHVAGLADATDAIESRANSILTPYPSSGGASIPGLRKVIINPVVNSAYITQYDPGLSGLLWHGNRVGVYQPNGTRKVTLLSSTEITTYTSGAVTIANLPQYQGANPPPAHVDVEDDIVPTTGGTYPNSDAPSLHYINEITYGNVIWVNDNVSTF